MFGEDANWGRILCAIGYAEADFDIDKVELHLRLSLIHISLIRKRSRAPLRGKESSISHGRAALMVESLILRPMELSTDL